ncbi:MAG: insulinase family protein, partial [Sphingobacterium sp.]|nr:insulinase family protein [Sphingobacterium sp.]
MNKQTNDYDLLKCRFSNFLIAFVLFVAFCFRAEAQQSGLDTEVRYGKLPNGFTYYVRHNEEPKQRAQLYLVNKVGSVLETDKQQGLAHFLEHMAFNGSKHFPKNELISYLQKSGVRFGSDLNAYTGFDETVYQLPIPTDDSSLFDNGLLIMRDWAHGLLLDQKEIDRERGVILEEKRLRQGAQQRVSDKTLPILVNGSIYAQRLPIGIESVLKTFKREEIVSFYEDWYRPDLQALIVVGDIDVAKVEQQVKTLFADLRMPKKVKERKDIRIPLTGKNQFIVVTDPEVPQVSFEMQIKHNGVIAKDRAVYNQNILRSVTGQLLSSRIGEYAKDPAVPMLGMNAGYGGFLSNLTAVSVSITPKEGQLQQAVEAAWTEVARVQKFGFTQSELDRVKTNFRSAMDRMLAEKDKRNSSSFVSEYQKHFTAGEIAPGVEVEYKWIMEELDKMTLQSVNTEIKKLIKTTDRDIIITGPDKEKATLPTEATVLQWLLKGESAANQAYVEKNVASALLSNIPAGGKVLNKVEIKELGVTELTLSNGVKIVLKPTEFQNDAIRFSSFSAGGTSLYSNADFESARNASGILSASGVGQFGPVELPKILTGKQVQVTPYINDYFEGVNGGSSVKDLETALQLVYLYFTEPRADGQILKKILGNAEVNIKTRYDQPENVFRDSISSIMGNYNYRRVPTTIERLNTIDLNKALAIYKDRFADASDFTFVFTGSFQVDQIGPLLAQYLGALPSTGRKESFKDLGIRSPMGLINKTVYKGREDKAMVVLVFDGDYTASPLENLKISALEQVLSYRLMERLREKESGVYTPSVGASTSV